MSQIVPGIPTEETPTAADIHQQVQAVMSGWQGAVVAFAQQILPIIATGSPVIQFQMVMTMVPQADGEPQINIEMKYPTPNPSGLSLQ
jgi:hypothetical protein